MITAVEEYFSESGILEEENVVIDVPSGSSSSSDGSRPYHLRRLNTGVSSIVGPDNGERPGGFVLVIDGAALNDVRVSPRTINERC